jgi:hypothetical protein
MIEIIVMDVKDTHKSNPDCPMRLAMHPSGYWYCVDCKRAIHNTRIEVPDTDTNTAIHYKQQILQELTKKPEVAIAKFKRRKSDKLAKKRG